MEHESRIQFDTSDLYLAAFLKVAAVPYLDATLEDGRVWFFFEDTGGIKDLKAQYYSRTAKVAALTYKDEIVALKSVVHQLMGRGGRRQ